jgi:hypothetical protein
LRGVSNHLKDGGNDCARGHPSRRIAVGDAPQDEGRYRWRFTHSCHCERSEAIQLCRNKESWIASSQVLLAMTALETVT